MLTKKVSRKGSYYQVLFEDGSKYKFHESIILSYGLLRPKIEINEQQLRKAIRDNDYYLALDKALDYLSGMHAKKEVYDYISKRYDREIAERVCEKLLEMKVLDDLAYAKFYATLAPKKGIGPNRVKLDLFDKEIQDNLVIEALLEYPKDLQNETADKLFQKHLPALKKESQKMAKEKMRNFLINKGFLLDTVAITLEKNQYLLDNISNDDELLDNKITKLYQTYGKKYSGKELKQKIIRNLSSKGFSVNSIIKKLESRDEND